jgi:hypothetical protein
MRKLSERTKYRLKAKAREAAASRAAQAAAASRVYAATSASVTADLDRRIASVVRPESILVRDVPQWGEGLTDAGAEYVQALREARVSDVDIQAHLGVPPGLRAGGVLFHLMQLHDKYGAMKEDGRYERA